MSEFLYWIVFFGILTLVMKWYTKRTNSKASKEDLLSDEEIKVIQKEKFPFWYGLYFVIYIVVMIGFAIGLVLLSWYFITHYPQWMLVGKPYLALSTNPYGLYLILLAFFPGIIFGGLLMSPFERIFPGIGRYLEQKQLEQWGMRMKSNSKTQTRKFIKAGVLMTIVIVPLFFLAADNYYYVDNQLLHYNSFWGFGEKTISLDNLVNVGAGAWPNNGKNASGINWEYILIFSDGLKFNMKEAGPVELKQLDDFLIQRNIPVEVTTAPNDKAMAWVNNDGSQALKDLFAQVFSESRLKK